MSDPDAWDRIAPRYAAGDAHRHTDLGTVHYGAQSERELRLLGTVRGKRVLDLGCGPGRNAVALAEQGAYVIAVDASREMIARARALAAEREVRIEWRVGDIAELAWLRADSVDVALATGVLEHVADLDRLLRQVHRVLRTGAPFVFDHPHPFTVCTKLDIDDEGALPLGRPHMDRSYFDEEPIVVDHHGVAVAVHPRSVSAILGALTRAGFALDALIEPEPNDRGGTAWLPASLIVRAKKLGS